MYQPDKPWVAFSLVQKVFAEHLQEEPAQEVMVNVMKKETRKLDHGRK
jgi:hypothetical protein